MRVRAVAAVPLLALQLVVVVLCGCGGASAQRVFISESYNGPLGRGIEVYNPNCWSIPASAYTIRIAIDGGAWNTTAYPLTGTLGARGCRTICSIGQSFVAAANCHTSPLGFTFTGNDAVGLFHNGVLIDAIGAPNSYVTTGWDIAGISTATYDRTLRRLPRVLQGNPTAFAVPTRVNNTYWTEWSVLALTSSGFNSHTPSVVPTTCPTFVSAASWPVRYYVRDLDCGSTGAEVIATGSNAGANISTGVSLQIRCPTTCAADASSVASSAVIGSGSPGPYAASSLVCLAAIVSGLTPLKGSNRAPASPTAAQQTALCAAGAYQVETGVTLWLTMLGTRSAFSGASTGTCFNSSASTSTLTAFNLSPRANTTCYNDCNRLNGGGACNSTTGICQCTGTNTVAAVNPLNIAPFFGDDCSLRNCTLRCYNGGTCNLNTGACTCPAGFNGAQCLNDVFCSRFSNCTGKGVCVDGYCSCNSPYYGSTCQFVQCPNACSDGGSCDPYTGTCTCDAGRLGADCALKQCPGSCFAQYGVCDLTTGTCVCDATANALNVGRGVCTLGVCPGGCSGHGTCNYAQRMCTCDAGWLGPDCSRAASA